MDDYLQSEQKKELLIFGSQLKRGLEKLAGEDSRFVAKVTLQKTASCHKSNIMAKLSAAKRGARSLARSL